MRKYIKKIRGGLRLSIRRERIKLQDGLARWKRCEELSKLGRAICWALRARRMAKSFARVRTRVIEGYWKEWAWRCKNKTMRVVLKLLGERRVQKARIIQRCVRLFL